MEGRKLLDAYVFHERQYIAKPIFKIIVIPWIFWDFFFHYFIQTWS